MRLLVSLCNLPRPRSTAILSVEDRSEEIRWVEIGVPSEKLIGCTGIFVGPESVHCAATAADGRTILAVLDRRTYAVLDVGYPENVKDVHSITVVGTDVYMVSTGTDEVRTLANGRTGGPTELVWRATTAGADTHHLNSILATDGRLLCSGFGPKRGASWTTAIDGYVVDLTTGEIAWQGIEQPHSLTVGPDDLYVVESRRARVRSFRGGAAIPVGGYPRGLAFTADGRGVAGMSRGRTVSRSLGTVESSATGGKLMDTLTKLRLTPEYTGRAGLVWFDTGHPEPEALGVRELDLSPFGTEVYDVAVLDS